jgi:hypothetical protein
MAVSMTPSGWRIHTSTGMPKRSISTTSEKLRESAR